MTRIQLIIEPARIVVRLHDNATSRDLLARLPMTVQIEDYARTEKIARLSEPLDTEGAPSAYAPEVGDLTYYAPWGNLAFFYRPFSEATGLVPLGVVESGLDALRELADGVSARVEPLPPE